MQGPRALGAIPLGDLDAIAAIETTDNHPFFVADRGWTRVDELSIGDLIPSADGTMLTLVSALWTHRIETVYNFGVEGFHTYFIGESEAWVHNCNFDEIARHVMEDRGRFAGKSRSQVVNYLKELVHHPTTFQRTNDSGDTIYRRGREIMISRGNGGTYFVSDTKKQAKSYFDRFE